MYVDSFEYYKGIIELRKEYDSFKMVDRSDIAENLNFLYPDGYGVIGYELTKNDEHLLVYHNSGMQHNYLTLPDGAWTLLADRDEAGLEALGTYSGTYPIFKAETLVFVPGNLADVEPSPTIPPEITNRLNVAYEGGDYTITSNTEIYAYNIDGGEYVTVDIPATSVAIPGLTVGEHQIRIQDQFGTPSEPFTVTIFENTTVTCEDGYTLVDGECVEDTVTCDVGYTLVDGECVIDDVTCDVGYSLVDGECVLDAVTCDEGYSLVDGECVIDNTGPTFEQTGCFSSLSMNSLTWMISLVGVGLTSIVLLRRKY
jgi:pullulanase